MTNSMLHCVAILVLATATAPAWSGEPVFKDRRILVGTSSPASSTDSDCESRIQKLDASQAEGEERLAEKRSVIDTCAGQYKSDKTIQRLVKQCAKYEEQPVLKQQFVAECQLAAFNYANALYTLKAQYGR
ncbi:MAG: hypothetical protein WA268_27445 [Xanthobacteraceae bacterium]